MTAKLRDPETCSRCLQEEEWDDLNHIPATGENVCTICLTPDDEVEVG